MDAGPTGAGAGGHGLSGGGLLCVANFPTNTGYAWNFIESLYAGIADRLAEHVRTWVAYPAMQAPSVMLRGSEANAVQLEVRLDSVRSVRAVLDFVRRNDIRIVYLADRPSWHPAYMGLRLAGVQRIIVHDHTSGERTVPLGARRWLKRMRQHLPGALADHVVVVSDYVAARKVEVDLLPPERVTRVWNSVAAPTPDDAARSRIRALIGLESERSVIACACRATPEKGVAHLLRAFDRLIAHWPTPAPPALVYFGDGPELARLRALRDALAAREAIFFGGYRPDAPDLIEGADVCVAPSLWQEAFGLYALEPLARGVPVIASQVGGIPEVVVDGETGLLVPPGEEAALEIAMRRLLEDPAEARRLGENGRRRASTRFSRDRQLGELIRILLDGTGIEGGARDRSLQHEPRETVAVGETRRPDPSGREGSLR